jgi:hypothetical protein
MKIVENMPSERPTIWDPFAELKPVSKQVLMDTKVGSGFILPQGTQVRLELFTDGRYATQQFGIRTLSHDTRVQKIVEFKNRNTQGYIVTPDSQGRRELATVAESLRAKKEIAVKKSLHGYDSVYRKLAAVYHAIRTKDPTLANDFLAEEGISLNGKHIKRADIIAIDIFVRTKHE